MEKKWIRISESLPTPYKTVLITDDGGISVKKAYRLFSEKSGNVWMDAEDDFTFYYLSEYPEWCYSQF